MRCALAGLILLLSTAAVGAADLRYPQDATLRAVQFIDDREGWAVGDEGVIWHSIDGGKSWDRQPSGVRASLRSLHFLDPYVGWVAGREEQTEGSAGVLLFTRDGGLTWRRILAGALPGLNQVRFTSDKVGFVVGDGCEQFGTGVFRTTNGGSQWDPVPGPRMPGWLTGDFQDGKNGILAGAWGRLATLRGDALPTGQIEGLGGRSLLAVALMRQRAIAVGQGGLVLTSESGGSGWGFANLKLPTEIIAGIDLHAVATFASKVWVIGRPGSFVLTSDDEGATWSLGQTGQPLPLHGVFFRNDKTGWAVGEMGTILQTTDGGKSWSVRHQGGKRAALLTVTARSGDEPFDALALLGADEGYLAVALRTTSADPASASFVRASDPERFAAAARSAGAASGEMLWQFPLPQYMHGIDSAHTLDYWNQQLGQQAEREMLRQLVLSLRIWRPDVVLVDHPDAQASRNAAGSLFAEALHEAVRRAADDRSFPEQIDKLGLSVWQVKRVYAVWEGKTGNVAQDNTALHPRLTGSSRDYAATAVRLVHGKQAPETRGFRLLDGEESDQAGILGGLKLLVGETRRANSDEFRDDIELRQALQARRNLLVMAEKTDDAHRVLPRLQPLLANLPDEQGASAAHALGKSFAERGQWLLARETFLWMVDRYPSHPLSIDAYRWLVRYTSSTEARRRQELGQFTAIANMSFMSPTADPKGPIQKASASKTVSTVQMAVLSQSEQARQWYRGGLEIAKRLSGFGLLYDFDPSVQFPLQAAKRRLGEGQASSEWMKIFRANGPKSPWQQAAASEVWRFDPSQPQPPRLALCRITDEKPLLDGDLNDACWRDIRPMSLTNAAGADDKTHATEAFFACDQDHLYVAVRCKHPEGEQVPLVKKRGRDDDLDAFDRVSILLDLDRDYTTYYRLEVDQRGCVREDCWGDRSWNPRWFVACKSDADGWQVEAAIPLAELTSDRIVPGNTWACNLVRILPGRGVQAWSLPADVEPRPEGMSMLIFQQDGKKGP